MVAKNLKGKKNLQVFFTIKKQSKLAQIQIHTHSIDQNPLHLLSQFLPLYEYFQIICVIDIFLNLRLHGLEKT